MNVYAAGYFLGRSKDAFRAKTSLRHDDVLTNQREGYRRIMGNIMRNARYLEERILASCRFELLTDANYLPVVELRLLDDSRYTVFQICEILRERGWPVPAYTLPPNAESIAVMQVVVKENFSRDMADIFARDLGNAIHRLETDRPMRRTPLAKGTRHRPC